MNSTALRSKTVVLTLVFALILPAAIRAAGWRLLAPEEIGVANGQSLVINGLAQKRCTLRPTVAERVPLFYSAASSLRADSAAQHEMPLLLSNPKNSLVRVSWNPCRLTSGSCIVAYSLLGYEYLRQNVHEGMTAAFIDTRQLLSGIYVLRLETHDGQSLGYARLVVAHPTVVRTRN